MDSFLKLSQIYDSDHYCVDGVWMIFGLGIGLYRENAIAIRNESGDSNGGVIRHNGNYVQYSGIYA